ncbi:MAG: hypothetical protein ACK5U7_11375 [Bacteroidota bacterium]|jgi:hypothetical protein
MTRLARFFVTLARKCGASNDDIFAEFRCPACGTLDGCMCASPGAPAFPLTPYEELRRKLDEAKKNNSRTTRQEGKA